MSASSHGRDVHKHAANVLALRESLSGSEDKIVEKTVTALTEHSCFRRAGGTYRGLGYRVMMSLAPSRRKPVFEMIRDLVHAIEESRKEPQYSAIDAFSTGAKYFLDTRPVRRSVSRRRSA